MLTFGLVTVVAAVAWVYLLGGHGGFWRTDQRLPPHGEPAVWPSVAAVVPARNEAGVLPHTLPTLLAQDYPGTFGITVVDDRSGDGTAAVAHNLAGAGHKLTVVTGAALPDGWVGKPWAMAQGVRAADAAAEYLLFTDADIAWQPGTLRALVAAAEADRRDLVSQMALLRTETGWERLVIPAFVYFFAQLYPFRRVNGPGRTAAAAGGCMLVRRRALAAAGGIESIRDALIDDVALARLLAGAGGRCWLGLSTDVRSIRRYEYGLSELWAMVARSAYTQLRYSPTLLAGTVAGLTWLYLLPPVALAVGLAALPGLGATLAAIAGGIGWAVMSVSFVPMLRYYRLSPWRSLTLPLIAALYTAMTVDSARRHYRRRGVGWRDGVG